MVIYMYLTILIVVCMLTGSVVTIIERRGLYPRATKKQVEQVSKPVVVEQPAPLKPYFSVSDSIEILEPDEIEILDDSIEISEEEIEILDDGPCGSQVESFI